MSKGSNRRPQSVSNKEFDDNWDAAFGKQTLNEIAEDNRLMNKDKICECGGYIPEGMHTLDCTFGKKYRCGWCGQPCNEDGITLLPLSMDGYDSADPVPGECCRNDHEKLNQYEYITHEMAMDAQDPSLEGQPY